MSRRLRYRKGRPPMGQDHHDRCTGPPASPQAAIEAARAQLLGGRGPGASPQEITAHTRARPRLGGYSIPQRREQVAAHTAVARGDPDALARQITAATGNQMAATARTRHPKFDPTPAVGALHLVLVAATAGAVLGAVATATVQHRRHRNR
jgi:hypothetical protein